jgi:CubicO group peptidase (beta-lactamase class C family)
MRTEWTGPACAVAWLLLAAGCLQDARLKLAYNDVPATRADWPVSTPEAQGIDPAGLQSAYRRFFAEDEFVSAVSLLVARHGYLVAEGYARDLADVDRVSALQSATKSVTSMLFGIALAQGLVGSLDVPFVDYLPPAYAAPGDMAKVTLADLLTMRSGIDFLNGDFTMEMAFHSGNDSLAHIMAKTIVTPPGQVFRYKDADPTLAADVLQRHAGVSWAAFAESNLFRPLGITSYVWTAAPDGLTYGAYGLYLRPRDFLKLGLLMLDGGTWQGAPIIPAAWVAESTGTQVTIPEASQPYPGTHLDYGFYWWLLPDRGVYAADGHGGQFLYVVPAKDLVIAFTAEPDTSAGQPTGHLDHFAGLADLIVAAAN